jgi:hypothetical protein
MPSPQLHIRTRSGHEKAAALPLLRRSPLAIAAFTACSHHPATACSHPPSPPPPFPPALAATSYSISSPPCLPHPTFATGPNLEASHRPPLLPPHRPCASSSTSFVTVVNFCCSVRPCVQHNSAHARTPGDWRQQLYLAAPCPSTHTRRLLARAVFTFLRPTRRYALHKETVWPTVYLQLVVSGCEGPSAFEHLQFGGQANITLACIH